MAETFCAKAIAVIAMKQSQRANPDHRPDPGTRRGVKFTVPGTAVSGTAARARQ